MLQGDGLSIRQVGVTLGLFFRFGPVGLQEMFGTPLLGKQVRISSQSVEHGVAWVKIVMKILKAVVFVCFLWVGFDAIGQPSAFNYQGKLLDSGSPATGVYEMRFTLWNAGTGGSLVSPVVLSASGGVGVTNGAFTVILDFGPHTLNGAPRWIEIQVRTNGSSGPFVVVTPRQAIPVVPYAVYASSVGQIEDADLPASVPHLNNANTFSGTNYFSQLFSYGLDLKPSANSAAGHRIVSYDDASGPSAKNDILAIGYNVGPRGGLVDHAEFQLYQGFESCYTNNGVPTMEWYVRFITPDVPGPTETYEPFFAGFDRTRQRMFQTTMRGEVVSLESSSGANPWARFQAERIDLFAPTAVYGSLSAQVFFGSGEGLINLAAPNIVGTLNTAQLADSVVTEQKLAALSVSDAKISTVSAAKVTGILANSNLSSNVPRLDFSNTFTTSNRFDSVVVKEVILAPKIGTNAGFGLANSLLGPVTEIMGIGYNIATSGGPRSTADHQLYEAFEVNRPIGTFMANRWSVNFVSPQSAGNVTACLPFEAVYNRTTALVTETVIRGEKVDFANSSGSAPWARFQASGHDLFAPTRVSGPLTATAFYGSGEGLSKLPAQNLVGVVPSASLPASDSGLVPGALVKRDAGGSFASRTIRLGDGTGTSEPPEFAGLVVRRINTRSIGGGQVVARTDDLTLERDGSNGGWLVRYPANTNGRYVISMLGMKSDGTPVNAYSIIAAPSAAGTKVLFTNAQGVHHFQGSFGSTAGATQHLTQVTLTRYLGDSQWVGTVTATYSQ